MTYEEMAVHITTAVISSNYFVAGIFKSHEYIDEKSMVKAVNESIVTTALDISNELYAQLQERKK